MKQKVTVDMLREHLNDYSKHLQTVFSESSVDDESKALFDEFAKYHHYIISEIIEYLEQ